jgi:hypothetical protein
LEIERLKKELKQSKKTSVPIKSLDDASEEETECMFCYLYIQNLIFFNVNLAAPPPPPLQPVTADTSVLMDELMAGTRRNNKKQHVSHSNSRESQVCLDKTFGFNSHFLDT